MDFHSSTFKDDTDIDIVTNARETLLGMDNLYDKLKELGVKYNVKVDENNIPNKEKNNEIIAISSICNIPSIRIIINNKKIDVENNFETFENIVKLIEEFISYFNYL